MGFIFSLLALIVGMIIMVIPVQLAAKALGAKRTDFWTCFGALVVATILHAVGTIVPVFGTIVAFLLGGLAFSMVLETDFLRGLGISILHTVFAVILAIILAILGLGGLFAFSFV